MDREGEDVCAIGWYYPRPSKIVPGDEAAMAVSAKNLNNINI